MNSHKGRSLFATALGNLLERADGHTKAEWAEVLDVTPAAISQWLGDRTVPRASVLCSILDVARSEFGPGALDEFIAMAKEPAMSVSPNGSRMAPTVAHYMIEPIREAFDLFLQSLPPSSQKEVLLDAAENIRARLSGENLTHGARTVSDRKLDDPKWRGSGSAQIVRLNDESAQPLLARVA